MIDSLFSRRIHRDMEKVSDKTNRRKIIQTLSPDVTEAVLLDIMGNNQGIHTIIMDPETTSLVNAMKKGKGISYETIRKAYDNDELARMNRDKNAPQGWFPTAINLLLTGTPDATAKFLDSEIEGGTASRMCLCVLPQIGKDIPTFPMPEGEELNQLQDQLDEWTAKFAYTTDADGNDCAVAPHETDMEYVCRVLKDWLNDQYNLAQYEKNPARATLRMRIASSAFNCAIVWHMLFEEPTYRQRAERARIEDLTIYMANYLMERWLHKFGAKYNVQQAKFSSDELVKVQRSPQPELNQIKGESLPKDGIERGRIYKLLKDKGLSVAEIAIRYGQTKDQVYGCLRRYNEKVEEADDKQIEEDKESDKCE